LQLLAEFLAGAACRIHHLVAGVRKLLIRRLNAGFNTIAQCVAGFGDCRLRAVDHGRRR
jgi:hypothetical protein